MPVNDVYRLTHTQSVYGITAVNEHYYQVESPASDPAKEGQDLAEAFEASVLPQLLAAAGPDYRSECLVSRMLGAGANDATQYITGAVGTRSGETCLPCNTVATIGKYTDLHNQHGRGRMFFSGMCVSDENDNCWNAAGMGWLNAIGISLISQIGGGSFSGVYDSRLMTGPPPELPRDLLAYRINSQVRKLRSRTKSRACG